MKKIWITWEKQRRSIELSKALEADYYQLLNHSSQIRYRPIRYFYLSGKTIKLLLKIKPGIVFVQNPSIVLAFLVCMFKNLFGYKLIIDRHSNFKFHKDQKKIKWKLFNILSNYTIKKADLTIVTNEFLKDYVNKIGGHGFILEDKLPKLNEGEYVELEGEKNIVFISSFSEDEPLFEVVKATNVFKNNWRLYITGNYKNYNNKEKLLKHINEKIVLTGYLNEKDYQSLLKSADVIIVLTMMAHTLTCGAYEGVVQCRPVVASNTIAMRNYFYKGFIFTDHDADSIARSIQLAIENSELLSNDLIKLKKEIEDNWNVKFKELLSNLVNN